MTTIHSEYPAGSDTNLLVNTVNASGWYSQEGLFNTENQIIGNVWTPAIDTVVVDPNVLKEVIDNLDLPNVVTVITI
jgi:hypothetical protein